MARNSLKTVFGRNFRGISDEQVYELEDQGLVLISGRNGEGKSSLFIELPVWVLYNRTPSESVPGNAVRNRQHRDESLRGGCTFVGTNGIEYRVIRERKNSEATLSLEFRNEKGEWEDQSMTTPTETQDAVIKAWGEDYDTYANTRLFTSDVVHYPNYTDGEKKKVIDKIIGLDAVSEAASLVLTDLREVEDQEKVADWAVKDREKEWKELGVELAAEEEAASAWDDKVREERGKIKARKGEIEKWMEKIPTERDAARKKLKSAENVLTELQEKTEKPSRMKLDLSNSLATSKERLRSLGRDHTRLLSKKRELAELSEDRNCDECGQKIPASASETQLERNAEEIAKVEKSIAKVEGVIGELERAEKEVKKTLSVLEEGMESVKKVIKAKTGFIDLSNEHETDLREELSEIPEKLRKTDNPHPARVEDLKARRAKLEARKKEAEEDLATANAKKIDLKVLQECFGNKGFRTLMIEAAIQFLNSKISGFMAMIDSPILVELVMKSSGELAVNVDHPQGGGRYKDCSRGERRIIDLVILFAFFELRALTTGGYPPQVVFDEAFENVDVGWQEALAVILRSIVDRGSSVFFISHNAGRLEGLADQNWTISGGKINGRETRRPEESGESGDGGGIRQTIAGTSRS